MNSTTFGIVIIVSTLLIGAIIIVFLLTWLRSHRLRVRDPMNSKSYLQDFWVLEHKDKYSGVLFWKSVFWQPKIKTPLPPSAALEVGRRGRKFAECYRVSEDEFVWITDEGLKTQTITDKDGHKKKVIVGTNKDGKQYVIDTFKPFSPVQRETIVNQYEKAQALRNRKWSADKIVSMSAMGAFVVIILAIFIFWGDIAKPILDLESRLETREQRIMQLEKDLATIQCGQPAAYTPSSQQANVIVQQGNQNPPKQ